MSNDQRKLSKIHSTERREKNPELVVKVKFNFRKFFRVTGAVCCRGFLIKYKFQFTALGSRAEQIVMDTFVGIIFWDEKFVVGGSSEVNWPRRKPSRYMKNVVLRMPVSGHRGASASWGFEGINMNNHSGDTRAEHPQWKRI